MLIRTGKVDINSKSIDGRSPIFWPAAYGYETTVTLLLNAGADPNYVDVEGQTAISMARRHGHSRIVHLLERFGM